MGTLYIVSTPIGNLEDITIRAIRTLFSVDIIACEDTRRTGLLLKELQNRYTLVLRSTKVYRASLLRFDEHTEGQATSEIIDALHNGKHVALVSDSGTPIISDPGYELVFESLKRGIKVVSIPGPSAVLAALTSSGLPANHFLFLGYPPEKKSHRRKLFEDLRHFLVGMQGSALQDCTYIFYCAPHKLLQTLTDMKEVFGDIEVVIARELTKVHEEVIKLKVPEAITKFSNPIGEFTILLKLPKKEYVRSYLTRRVSDLSDVHPQ